MALHLTEYVPTTISQLGKKFPFLRKPEFEPSSQFEVNNQDKKKNAEI